MTQLERLARPFPSKYVKPPAKGKYGSYVPHDVVQQALLAILGPIDIHVGEVFRGESGKIEGCLVTLDVEIDKRFVSVTEVGDCERPDNWGTQGARMKDAISDGIKRCAMRLGLGLHLWAQEDYFLYDQLRQENAEADRSSQAGGPGVAVDDGRALPPETVTTASATSPPALGDSAGAGVASTTLPAPDAAPAESKLRKHNLKARCVALTNDNVSVADAREALKLPLVDSCNEEELSRFEALVADLEAGLEAPFAEAKS